MDGVVDGFEGGAVVADEAVFGGVAVGGDADAEQEFDELAGVAGGVAGGDGGEADARVGGFGDGVFEGGDGLRFVVFDAEVDGVGADDVGGDLCTDDNFCGVFADLHVVAGDVGFAFGGVDDEGAVWVFEFAGAGEACAAKAADAALVDAFEEGGGVEVLPVEGGECGGALVLAVGLDDDGGGVLAACVDVVVVGDGDDGAGGGGVARYGVCAVFPGEGLAAQYVFADGDDGGLQVAVALAQG